MTEVTLSVIDTWVARFRRSVAGEALWATLMALAVLTFIRYVWGAFAWPDPIDFSAFVANARSWLTGVPYAAGRDPNAPHVILLFLPFTVLPARVGLAIWLGLSAILACASLTMVGRVTAVRLTPGLVALGLAAFLAAPPTTDMVVDGNLVWALWPAFTGAWILARGGKSFGSGVLMGALATAKPFLGLWLAYWVIRRDAIAFVGMLSGSALTLGIGLALAGGDAWLSWLSLLGRISWFDYPSNAGLAGLLARTTGADRLIWFIVSTAFAAMAFGWIARTPRDTDWEWLLVLLTSLLISPLGWRYYYCFAIGPLTGCLRRRPPTLAVALALTAWVYCPAFDTQSPSWLVEATLGSTLFWALTGIWCVVAFKLAPTSPTGPGVSA